MEEEGQLFLPCCYGYATTVRKAQGASLDQGCIFFDQKRRAAGRGYGYVAVSRFKAGAGCFASPLLHCPHDMRAYARSILRAARGATTEDGGGGCRRRCC